MLDTLIERYTAYLHVLEQARHAIGRRDEDALAGIDATSRELLDDMQDLWAMLQPDLASHGAPQLRVLHDLVARSLAQTKVHQAAVSGWMNELGHGVGTVRQGPAVSQASGVGTLRLGRFYRSNA